MRLGCIVEGDGEVQAFPVLVRRIWQELEPAGRLEMGRPFRLPRGKLLNRPNELERALQFQRSSADAAIILTDSDDDPACQLAPRLLERARAASPGLPVAVVLAEREYESWFLAGIESLCGRRRLRDDLERPAAHRTLRDAKGWLGEHMLGDQPYDPVVDQAKLSAALDLHEARTHAPSFDKLWRELVRLRDEVAGRGPR